MALSRRQFLKTGLVGGAILAGAGYASYGTFWGPGKGPAVVAGYRYRFFRRSEHQVVAAIVPVLMAGALPAGSENAATEEILRDMDTAISGFLPAVQKEIRQLFALLSFPPSRIATTGIWQSWHLASKTSVAGFLESWRNSRFDLLRSGYDALFQLTTASWYGNPKSWPTIGYGGPPPILTTAEGGSHG